MPLRATMGLMSPIDRSAAERWLGVEVRHLAALRAVVAIAPAFGSPSSAFRARNLTWSEPSPDASLDAAWEEEWHESLFQRALVRLRELSQPKHYQAFDLCVLRQVAPAEVARMLGLTRAQVYLCRHRLVLSLKRIVLDLQTDLERGSGI